jgi:hypothetical protein
VNRRPARVTLLVALALLAAAPAGCGGDEPPAGPRVDWIDDALGAVAEARDEPPAYLEVAATLEHVDAIVRDGDGDDAVLYRYDGDLTGPIEPRADPRDTFAADQVDLDPDAIFEQVRAELDDPVIVDLAIQAAGDRVMYDATIAGEEGGVLLVLLGPGGQILGAQAE